LQTLHDLLDNYMYFMMEHVRFENKELADMLLVYGECHKNQREAAALYAQRFPHKRHPKHGFFHSLYDRVCKYGLGASTRPLHVHRRANREIDAVRGALINNPHTSTRAIGRELNIEPTKVHRIIKNNLGWHPFKRHTTQRLFPADLRRREAFCEWMLEQVSAKDRVICIRSIKHAINILFYIIVLRLTEEITKYLKKFYGPTNALFAVTDA